MTNGKLQQIFVLQILHRFFQNNSCTCLQLFPDEATAALLSKYQFQWQNTTNGIKLYSTASSSISDYLSFINKQSNKDRFVFNLYSSRTDFAAFTDVSNFPVCFDSGFSGNEKTQESTVLFPEEGTVSDITAIGNVTIRFADVTTNTSFTIQFQSRATQWQYYVINKGSVETNALSIQTKNPVSFNGPVSTNTPLGESALLFSTGKNLLPLSEVPQYRFDLIDTSIKNGTKVLYKGLPNPCPKYFGQTEVNGINAFTSPMYVYL
jgi:hypothetical protein